MMSLQNMNFFSQQYAQYFNLMENNQSIKHSRSISIDNGQVTLKNAHLLQQLQQQRQQQQLFNPAINQFVDSNEMFVGGHLPNTIPSVNPNPYNTFPQTTQSTPSPVVASNSSPNHTNADNTWPTSNFPNGLVNDVG